LFILLNNKGIYSQMQHRYIGIHYEYGASMNLRYGRVDIQKGYYFVDCAIPRLIVSLCGWKMDEDKIVPVKQARYFSMRGGKLFKISNMSSLGFDITWDIMGLAAPPDSGDTKSFSGHIISPLQIGLAYGQSFGDNCSFVLIPSYGYALGKTRNDDGKHHKRMSVEMYFQYKIKWLTIYAGGGYAYFPKGIPMTYPMDASFGGPMVTAGIGFDTDW
ncbi:MAG: hypothetical protein ABIJ97_10640, partial [Bacteroidota bacterium]